MRNEDDSIKVVIPRRPHRPKHRYIQVITVKGVKEVFNRDKKIQDFPESLFKNPHWVVYDDNETLVLKELITKKELLL